MPNVSAIGGLPSLSVATPPPWTPNGGAPNQGQYEGPPTPQSSAPLRNSGQQAAAYLAAQASAKEQEATAWRRVTADFNQLAAEAEHCRNGWNKAINDMREAIHQEEQRRFRIEATNVDLNARVSTLEQEKQDLEKEMEDMSTGVMLVQGQNRALEQEVTTLKRDATNSENETTLLKGEVTSLETQVTSLKDEITRKEADWSEDRTTSAAAKAEVDGHLVAQRNLRLKIEEERDQVKEEVKELQCELQASTTEKKVATDNLNTARGEVSSLKTSLQDTQQKVDDANAEIKQARSEIQTLKSQVESQKAEITSLQGAKNEVGQLRSEKAKLHQKFDNAKLNHAAVANTLTQTKKKNEELERQNNELNQRCYRTGQERDAADAAVEKLKVQVKQHEADKSELHETISKHEENLREETRVADMFRQCAAQLQAERDTPQAPGKCSDRPAVQTRGRDAKESSPSKLSERHITPMPDSSTTTSLAISNQASYDESNSFVAPVASMRPSQPSKEPPSQAANKISMPLASKTPVKSKTPKVTSPLVGTSSDPAQDDALSPKTASSNTNANSHAHGTHKRKRDEADQQQDPRLVKQTLTGSRKLSSENVRAPSRYQGFRPSNARDHRSPEGDPYARKW